MRHLILSLLLVGSATATQPFNPDNVLAMRAPHDHNLDCLKSGSRCEFRLRAMARERMKRPLPQYKPYVSLKKKWVINKLTGRRQLILYR